jgi:hypothetical protein
VLDMFELDEEFYQCRGGVGWLSCSSRLSGTRFTVRLEPIENALLEFSVSYGGGMTADRAIQF